MNDAGVIENSAPADESESNSSAPVRSPELLDAIGQEPVLHFHLSGTGCDTGLWVLRPKISIHITASRMILHASGPRPLLEIRTIPFQAFYNHFTGEWIVGEQQINPARKLLIPPDVAILFQTQISIQPKQNV